MTGVQTCALPILKPSLVEWKPVTLLRTEVPFDPLKPSLVEWKLICLLVSLAVPFHLETFLGGMETKRPPTGAVPCAPPLKPSLVEWKQVASALEGVGLAP